RGTARLSHAPGRRPGRGDAHDTLQAGRAHGGDGIDAGLRPVRNARVDGPRVPARGRPRARGDRDGGVDHRVLAYVSALLALVGPSATIADEEFRALLDRQNRSSDGTFAIARPSPEVVLGVASPGWDEHADRRLASDGRYTVIAHAA